MSQQLEKIKELIAKREQARLGGGRSRYVQAPPLHQLRYGKETVSWRRCCSR